MPLPLPQQEGVGQTDKRDVMMPALPAAPFVMVQSQFLFQLLVVLFDSPAQFGQLHQASERDPRGQVREPILRGSFGLGGPLDEQPDRFQFGPVLNMAVRGLHSASRKAAPLGASTALSPPHGPPPLAGQARGQIAQGLRLTAIIRSAGATPTPSAARLDPLRRLVPNPRVRLHPHHLRQLAICQALAELGVVAVAGVGQNGLRPQESV